MNDQSDKLEIRDDGGLLRHSVGLLDRALHGLVESFDTDGRLLMRSAYRDGQRHGGSEYRQGEQVQMTQQFDQGRPHGATVVYDPAGHVAAELNFVDGLLQGEARYYAHGRLVRRASYRDGRLDGVAEDLLPDGTVVQRTPYRANVLHGTVERFWTNGQPMERTTYDNGLCIGEPQRFDQNGRLQGEAPKLVNRMEKLFRGS